MTTDAAPTSATPIRSLTVLPAHREDVELHTADGLTLVGELVLARNQTLQHVAALGGGPLSMTAQRLNVVTTELQEAVMKTRLQPVERLQQAWQRRRNRRKGQ